LLGFFQENGPWVVDNDNSSIYKNLYSWNARANVLYLESPAGVGYSMGDNIKDRTHNDYSQSLDSFNALVLWYSLYPEFKSNPLFISGESYGGIYVPYLAW
jgi:carboxypeptidase C (cathepsin A)